MAKKPYDSVFKLKVVLETFNQNTTLDQVKRKYNLSNNAIHGWKSQFYQFAHLAFETKRKANTDPAESVDELKKIIADLAVENSLLKKVSKFLT